ncbi:MAG: heme A synthase [Anaerolineae bacterium]
MTATTLPQTSNLPVRRLMPGLALSALVSTILLIAMGSIVRVTGNGLGCPDWPLCYGRVIPPALTGAWLEFTHRLLGGVTSIQILLLAVFAWRSCRHQPRVYRPAVAAAGLLVVQVSLGGLHVIYEIPPATGWIHTGVAMLIVGLLTVEVGATLPALQSLRGATGEIFRNRRFGTWVALTAGATYVLLLTGSYVTRSGASLACPSFPMCGSSAPAMRRLIDIQMLHRYAAYSVAFLTLMTIVWLLRRQEERGLARIAYGLGALLLVQFGLGIANVLLSLPMWSRVLHLTVAATLWAGLVLLWSLDYVRQPAADTRPDAAQTLKVFGNL